MLRFFLLTFCFCLTACGLRVSDVFEGAGGSGGSTSDGTAAVGGADSSQAGSASPVSSTASGENGGSALAGSGGASSSGDGGAAGSGGAGGEGGAAPNCHCAWLGQCEQAHCAAACPNADFPCDAYPFLCSTSPDTCTPCLEHFCRCNIESCTTGQP
jgi:hypothetical protein